MVSATLSTFVLAAVLSSFLFLGRSGISLRNYSDMEAQARRGLEVFATDVRQASAISWSSATDVTLTVASTPIRYEYDASARTFTRTNGDNSRVMITHIIPGTFQFQAFTVAGNELPLQTSTELAAAGNGTKQLQLSLKASRSTNTLVTATNTVLSARFILRNKVVTA